jgi:hypothetical protein
MTLRSLEDIAEFRVPADVVNATDEQLREVGVRRAECFVLWVGQAVGERFQVEHAYVPKQNAYQLPDGLCVTVDGDELHRLNKWLYTHSMTLGAQVHSHPSRAYHSDTDSTYPIVTQRGGLSIVVPDFGRHGLRGSGVESYRLAASGWHHLRRRAVRRLVQFQPDHTVETESER